MNEGRRADSLDPLLTCRDVVKTFPSGHGKPIRVLRNLSLEVAKGELLAVTGASGVGKSTMLHILGVLEPPDTGTVMISNTPVYEMDEGERAPFRNRNIGFVFQFHHLLPEFSALENVMMPALIAGERLSLAQDRAAGLLEEVGLAERASHRPGMMSGGEQQRVAIARALIMAPPLVLADEPTGNLDAETSDRVYRLFRQIQHQRGFTAILVTHNEELASQCDRRLQLTEGTVVETGLTV